MSDTRAPQQPASDDETAWIESLQPGWRSSVKEWNEGDGFAKEVAAPAAQQPAEPLTDAQIDAIGAKVSDYDDPSYFRVMARAVEAKVRAALAHPPAVDKKESA